MTRRAPQRARGVWSGRVAAIGAAIAGGCFATPAQANVTAPAVIAGPDRGIVEFGGVAMADDGTGGAIYRRTDATGSHIYVVRYTGLRWTAPVRVDTALPYSSYEPRIAAAAGGQLLAIWAQDYAHKGTVTLYRLQSALLQAGARRFETPVGIDRDVGGPAGLIENLDPVVAMNNAGVAYLTYRVQLPSPVLRRPLDIGAAYRVARLNPGTWSVLGAVNRNPDASVPAATAGNGPQVSVDSQGNGVVAFLEPDDAGVERVWARRLFGTRLGLVLKASPFALGGVPITGDADAFSLAGGGFGVGSVVVRQQPGDNSPLPGPRIFVNQLPPSFDDTARDFTGAKQVTDSGTDLGAPRVAVDAHEDTTLAYASAGAIRIATSTARSGPQPSTTIDTGSATGLPEIANGPRGASVTAWPVVRDDVPGVAVQQNLPGSGSASALLSGPAGGSVAELSVAGSGLGDALVAFRQGDGDQSRIIASGVQVPPQPFLVFGPEDWVRPKEARVSWERPASAVGQLTYDVLVDGVVRVAGLRVTAARLPVDGLDDGAHEVRVRATDAAGQSSVTSTFNLEVDGSAPTATARLGARRRVTVRITDGKKADGSGTEDRKTSVSFGDGEVAKGDVVASHRYQRAGRYRIRVRTADAAGNARTTVLTVRVR